MLRDDIRKSWKENEGLKEELVQKDREMKGMSKDLNRYIEKKNQGDVFGYKNLVANRWKLNWGV